MMMLWECTCPSNEGHSDTTVLLRDDLAVSSFTTKGSQKE
jgi:hypothetical protein